MQLVWHPVSKKPKDGLRVWVTVTFTWDGIEYRRTEAADYDEEHDTFLDTEADLEDLHYHPDHYSDYEIYNVIAWAHYATPTPYEG